ncbi:MAG: hypothetical protein S0880_31370 [Actinomycetota bacterium]|nr:hypothetical protein [Actinomycetota bacterium]
MTRSIRHRTVGALSAVTVGAALVVASPAGAQPPWAEPAWLIDEHFSTDAGVMELGPGGWEVSGGRLGTHHPVRSGAGAIGNSNLAVHETVVSGDLTVQARVEAEETRGAWDDVSVVLGWQDPDNYLYVSFNESNDPFTSGIFAVVDGVGTELADIDRSYSGGTSYSVNVTREGDEISVYVDVDWYSAAGPGPIATATTDLFPTGKVGVGSRNNAVFMDLLRVTDTPIQEPPWFNPEQGWEWGIGFVPVSGGWHLDDGWVLSSPITSGAGAIGNSNLAVTEYGTMFPDLPSEDFQFFARAVRPPATASAWDDVSLIFGYQDPGNYLFVSFNESNDPFTSGIFAVVDGVGTELTDITVPVRGGGVYDVRIDRWGEDVWVYLNGQLIATAETELFPRGKWGYGTRNGPARFGPVYVEVWPA